MLSLSLLSLVFTALPVLSQIVYDSTHNATPITGTWSTGSGAVQTGPVSFPFKLLCPCFFLLTVLTKGVCKPPKLLLHLPKDYWPIVLLVSSLPLARKLAHVSCPHSTDDGYFEQAEYRFSSNASDPHCITGVVTFQHGTYELLSNGSILLNPFSADGRQQVQDPCAAVSNQINQWSATVLFQQWRIFPLPTGGNHLNLYEFDGSPVAPMNLVANPPNMLPTQVLTKNVSAASPSKRAIGIEARSNAPRNALLAGSIGGLAGLGALLTLLV